MRTKAQHDVRVIFRYLLPELKPFLWPILGSLGITGLVVVADLFQPLILKWLIDAATVTMHYFEVLQCLLFLLFLTGIRSLLSYWEIFARSRVGEAISHRLRNRTFAHVLHIDLAAFHDLEDGAIIHRIMHDCGEVGRVYVSTKLLPTIAQLVQALALIGFILALSWQLGLASILVFPVGWFLSQRMTRRSHDQVIRLRDLVEQGHSMLQETFACLREVRVAGNESGEIHRWENWLQSYGRVICQTTTRHQFIRVTLDRMINWIGLCIVFGWGGWQLLIHQMTIGSLLALSLYTQQLYTTLSAILSGRLEAIEVANALKAINDLLRLPREWPDQGQTLHEGPGHLEFNEVSFSHCEAETLHSVSFRSSPGQITGIVGSTGSGKSTLINLCLRLYPVSTGRILLDGQDIATLAPHGLRQRIGYVPQDIQLRNMTIRENLLYGLQKEVQWEHVLEICRKTCVHAFVQNLPDRYETVVGARGGKLSGGEKQRIALARALIRDPKILLLDEATSALDSITEAAIVQYLLQISKQKNCIVVAHRLATVQSADQILVVEGGEIIERDSPDKLSHQNGLYAALYRTQQLADSKLETMATTTQDVLIHETGKA